MKSYFQLFHSDRLAKLFAEACGLPFYEELPVGKNRVDLGTCDNQYGIEIKSNTVDLKSGYGLNQEQFEYGYVVAPLKIAHQVIGYLYMRGMDKTGFIGVSDDNRYVLVKPAVANADVEVIGKSRDSVIFDVLSGGATDRISHLFYENNAIIKRR